MSDEHLRLGLRALRAQGFGALDDAQLLELLQGTYRELVERNKALLVSLIEQEVEWAPSADRPPWLGGDRPSVGPPEGWPLELRLDYIHNCWWTANVSGGQWDPVTLPEIVPGALPVAGARSQPMLDGVAAIAEQLAAVQARGLRD